MLPLVVRVENAERRKREFAFAESPVRIGRSPLNHIQLEEEFISRIQAVIRFDRDEINYFNVGSTNVTVIDGREIVANEEVRIAESSIVSVGALRMRFAREAVAKEKLTRSASKIRSSSTTENHDLEKTMSVEPAAISPSVKSSKQKAILSAPPSEPAVEPSAGANYVLNTSNSVAVTRSKFIQGSQRPRADAKPSLQPSSRSKSPRAVAPDPVSAVPYAVAEPKLPVSVSRSDDVSSCYEVYRQAWLGLFQALKSQLENADNAARPQLAANLQKKFPQIVREPEFRKLLKSFGLTPRKPDSPELEEWLRRLSKGLFPTGLNLASGMTIERIIRVLEVFSQVFVEIHAAQNEARKQLALQSSGTGSLLSSEDPEVVLAYLLNPSADSEQRLKELEQCITKLAVHETALFGAIKDGVYELLQSIAPEAIAKEEGVAEGEDKSGGLLDRLMTSQESAREARLWRRYRAMHENLMDGKHYQRRFVGREFARIYLRAMEKLIPDS